MKIQVAKEDKSFFEREGWIEFDNLFSSEQIKKLAKAIDLELIARASDPAHADDSLSHSLHFTTYAIGKRELTSSEIAYFGRDLLLSSSDVKSFFHSRKLAEAAYQLLDKKPLRWAFDHVVTDQYLHRFLCAPIDIEKSISINRLLLVGILTLDETVSEEEREAGNKKHLSSRCQCPVYPERFGNLVLFNPSLFKHSSDEETSASLPRFLFKHENIAVKSVDHPETGRPKKAIMFGLTDSRPIYCFNENDMATHQLKQYGYVFGDRLKETTHPVLYR